MEGSDPYEWLGGVSALSDANWTSVENGSMFDTATSDSGSTIAQAATAEKQSSPGRENRPPAMPAIDCGARGSAPAIEWEDVALLITGEGPLCSTALDEREHIMTNLEEIRRIYVEKRRVRRKPGGDRWLNSGGKKGSILVWVPPGFGLRKRYGKVVSATHPSASLRYAEFGIASGSHDQSVACENSISVFILDAVKEESLRRGGMLPSSDAPGSGAGAGAGAGADAGAAYAGAAGFAGERPTGASMIPQPQVYTGSADAESSSAAVLDLVQNYGSKFISFQTQDDGKAIELGVIEKGGDGIKLSSAQGDFAEWHRRVPQEPPFREGDVVGFTKRGEITRQCTASGSMMLGVVSRSAVVEGSAPPVAERHLYDSVAYTGVVPVRVVQGAADAVGNAWTTQCIREKMGVTAGDILVPSGRCDGTAVAVSVQDMPAGSLLAVRRVGVVLKDCEWNGDDNQPDDTGQLVEATIVPPASTVAASTRTSVNVTFSILGALLVVGGLAMVAQLLVRLSRQPPLPGQDNGVSAANCCCTQPGRSLADCGTLCSCSESCKHLCPEPPAWDPQCYLPYTTLSDSFRSVEHLTGWPLKFRGHADAPLTGTDEFKTLCPTSPDSELYSTNNNRYYQTTGVGGGHWYRFIGAAGDRLPLYPPPEWHCGTANGGWLSGYNRTATNGTATSSRLHPSISACGRDSALYANCSSCAPGSNIDGGVETVGGLCRAHCNTFGIGKTGWCGTSDAYVNGGLDCTPCRNWVPGAESEFSDGPPVGYAEPGRYPTAAEGKVPMVVCFSAGVGCQNQPNTACGGSTCWRHQAIQAVQCDGFYLWRLNHVPYCRSGFCTVNSSMPAEYLGSA